MIIFLIKLYQSLQRIKQQVLFTAFGISISCKHQPSCSAYTARQLKKSGTIMGLMKGCWRVLTCW